MEKLIIAGKEFNSRLFLGTGKFNSNQLMEEAILASGTEMVTVAMKRIELNDKEDDMLKHIVHPHIQLLPNTSGVRTAEEAVFAAQMAREAFGTNWLKLEIHPDPRYLLPDSVETLKATEELVKLGFVVLPYCQADPTLCKRLEEAGAATVMPLAAPIGTNKGLQTHDFLRIIIEQSNVPVVVDAGIGAPSLPEIRWKWLPHLKKPLSPDDVPTKPDWVRRLPTWWLPLPLPLQHFLIKKQPDYGKRQ